MTTAIESPLSLRRLLDCRTILHWTPGTGWRLETLPPDRWQEPQETVWTALSSYRRILACCYAEAA